MQEKTMVQDGCCGKTFRGLFPQTEGMTLPTFLEAWCKGMFLSLKTDGTTQESASASQGTELSNGVCLTLNTSTSHKGATVCSLYSTLEHGGVDRRYYLSKRACQGILNRANAHHKDLPPELEKALHSAIDNSNTCDDSPSDSDDEDDDMDDSSDDDSDTNDYDDGSENGSDMNSEPNQSTPDEASHTDCKNSQVVSFMTGHTKSLGSGISYADKSYTLSCANDTAVAIPINMRDALRNPTPNDNIRGKGWNKDGEPSYTITTELHPGVVTFEPHWAEYDGSHISESNVASTLRCNPGSNRLAVAYEEKKGMET